MGPEIGAHIAAVPSNGQECPWAECRNCTKNQELRESLKWLVACSVRVEFSSYQWSWTCSLTCSSAENGPFDVRTRSRDQRDAQLAKAEFHGNPPTYP